MAVGVGVGVGLAAAIPWGVAKTLFITSGIATVCDRIVDASGVDNCILARISIKIRERINAFTLSVFDISVSGTSATVSVDWGMGMGVLVGVWVAVLRVWA